jgi:hypothetical protein
MGTSALAVVLALTVTVQAEAPRRAGAIRQEEVDYQSEAFQRWWETEWLRTFDDLPTEGEVPDFRVPYSGHDYPDSAGGTVDALWKYDEAFHGGRPLATEYERIDVGGHRRRPEIFARRPILAAIFGGGRPRTPGWYGHCNGWTAAAIRHAEPQRSVRRNGVVFTPADIKGLLAEIYMYSDSEFLGGVDAVINPATLHLTLANWLGRGSHPVGMETAVGEVVINYPIFAYTSKIKKHSDTQVEVHTVVTYAVNTNREYNKGPKVHRKMSFHYLLNLNEQGDVTGGRYYGDSQRIDMLWTPLRPAQGGEEGNERGNPHVDVKEVLAIWRESVDKELRDQWLNINPTAEDRVILEEPAPAEGTELAEDTESADDTEPAEDLSAGESPPAAETPPASDAATADAAGETPAAEPAADTSLPPEPPTVDRPPAEPAVP